MGLVETRLAIIPGGGKLALHSFYAFTLSNRGHIVFVSSCVSNKKLSHADHWIVLECMQIKTTVLTIFAC